MRSCEYLLTKRTGKTKRLRIRNFRFFRHNKLAAKPRNYPGAKFVSITFEAQKNELKNATVTHQGAASSTLCPVRVWAAIIIRLLRHPATTDDTFINTLYNDFGSIYLIKDNDITNKVREVVKSLGPEVLGFDQTEVGTHSIRASMAMALHLAGEDDYVIQMLGRWESNSFMSYIRRQVQEFSQGLSTAMVSTPNFFTTPEVQYHDA